MEGHGLPSLSDPKSQQTQGIPAERRHRNGVPNMSTEPLTPREIRQGIADKLATMPGNVDTATGKSDVDRQADADRFARFTEAQTPMAEAPPAQVGMKANPLQGHSSGTAPTPAPSTTLGRIRAQAAKINNL
jgi:hypothetical protein